MIETIPNNTRINIVKYKPTCAAICSVGQSPFLGKLKIKYTPNKVLLEFESFEVWLKEISLTQQTIESLCELIFNELDVILDCSFLKVTIYVKTIVHSPVKVTKKRGKYVR